MADLSKIVCLEQDCRHGTEQTGSSGSGNDTYTKAEIDSKDADIRAAASEAKSAANNAQSVNQTQDGQIKALQEAVDNLHNYEHPAYSANQLGFYKFANDEKGHVTDAETVTKEDITALGIPNEDTKYEITSPQLVSDGFFPDGPVITLKGTDGHYSHIASPNTYTVATTDAFNSYNSGAEIISNGDKYRIILDLDIFAVSRFYEESAKWTSYPIIIDSYITMTIKDIDKRFWVRIYTFARCNSGDMPTRAIVRQLDPNGQYSNIDWQVYSGYATNTKYDGIVTRFRIGIDSDTYGEIRSITRPKVYTTNVTSAYGDTLGTLRNSIDINAVGVTAVDTMIELTSQNASNVAFTGDYNDLANKPTIPDISGKQDKSTAVTHSANTAVGSATKPVYIAADGKATPITHSVNSDVPANAKFTDTTYSDATQSAHGLMTAADKKKLNGMDLTKYLPLSGGVMTGNIDLASNGVDLLVGTQRAVQGTYASAVAGATVAAKEPLKTGLPKRKSLIGSWLDQNSAWHSILSVRHRNGWNDGPSYGFYLRSLLTSNGDLCWNKQTGVDKWQGERVLLDSINYSSYAAPLSHTHRDIDQIGNVGYYGSDEADSNGWYKIYSGTLTGYADRVARLSIVRSYGKGHGIVLFHLRCNNNSSIIIHDLLWETRYKFDENHIAIKTNKNEYGIYVYQNSVQWGRIKVRVLESCGTSSNWTMTISNNSTKESSFTPTATGKDGSTVAKANEADTLTETAWTDVPETNISPRYGKNIKYLKSGNTVYVRGSISFSSSLNNPCCGTMPSELLPDDYQDHVFTAWNLKGGVPTAYPVVLGTDGKIILMNPTSTANWFVAGRAYNFNFNYHIG